MSKFKVLILLSAVFVIYFFLSLPFFSGDVKNHLVWGESILREGSLGFYEREFHDFSFPNYPPLSMGLFTLSLLFFKLTVNIVNFLNSSLGVFPSNLIYFFQWENTLISYLKLPAILPVLGIGYIIYLFKPKLKYVLFYLFNPAIIYLAVIWGQNDLLQFFFIIFAFYLLFKKRLLLSYIAAGLAILSKQTALVLWVVFLITVFKMEGLKKVIQAFLITVALFYLTYLPFHQLSLTWPFEFYNKTLIYSTGFLVSDNAINLWGVVFNFQKVDASQNIFLMPWVNWGYLLFALIFIPLTITFIKKKFGMERLFFYSFLVSILYFFTLTRMHERYLIPAVIFSSILILFNKKYWINLVFFTLLHFLNLYRGLYQPSILFLDPLVNSLVVLQMLVMGYFLMIVYNVILFVKGENE